MARPKRVIFWTPKRLKELRKLFRTMNVRQLAIHFGKSENDIQQAHSFDKMHRRLKISTVRKNGCRTTIYRAAYAEGAITGSRYSAQEFD